MELKNVTTKKKTDSKLNNNTKSNNEDHAKTSRFKSSKDLKSDIKKSETFKKKTEIKPEPEVVESTPKSQPADDVEFSPMPKAKPVDNADVSVLWGQLLDLIPSPPTKALLKQWANAVKITPEEIILTMKNEVFLNQVNSGSKKAAVVSAADKLFSQENSNVIIRLPQADDVEVKPATSKPMPMKKVQPTPSPLEAPDEEEIQQAVSEVKASEPEQQEKKEVAYSTMHSDQVNMVMDLFDGKIIE